MRGNTSYDTSRSVDPAIISEIAAFKEALQRLGWSEGRNIQFEGRFNLPNSASRQKLAKELIALKADVILTSGCGTGSPSPRGGRKI